MDDEEAVTHEEDLDASTERIMRRVFAVWAWQEVSLAEMVLSGLFFKVMRVHEGGLRIARNILKSPRGEA